MPTFIANFFGIYQYFDDSTGVISRAVDEVNEKGGFACAFTANLGSRQSLRYFSSRYE